MRRALAVALLALSLPACDLVFGSSGPLVTGFAMTDERAPEYDASAVCGRPSRTSGMAVAVPNPYPARSAYEAGDLDRRLRFTNLPGRVRVEIVPAVWWSGPAQVMRPVRNWGDVVRVIEQDDEVRSSVDWDLRDGAGALVPSGFYRVTFTFHDGPPSWLAHRSGPFYEDVYVVQREDRETWRDPTGCLGSLELPTSSGGGR